ncbi:MAG TPA: FAD binding domain-containing protein [Verrucomicrobiae bacterium]|nr:FAD binding domain-containing protein [Verrucomicrobiae bacterium]
MNAFQYASATSPASARELLGDNGAYLGGGNDVLNRMKDYLVEPKTLVNVKTLGLNRIEPGPTAWKLGATVTVAELEDHSELKRVFPGLQQAAAEVGSRQIRNVATIAGNLSQHSRCWYYRHRDTVCLKKKGDLCYARHGENKYHSLFSGNTCISPVVSNLSIALAVLDATVVVFSGGQEKRMTIPEFYAKAWENPLAHNSLNAGDLVVRVEVPVQPSQKSAYQQISEKASFDWALVSCSVSATVNGRQLSSVRIALGAISPVPHMVKAANDFLQGKTLDEATADEAARLLLARAEPMEHNGYKVPMARALVRRTLMQLIA